MAFWLITGRGRDDGTPRHRYVFARDAATARFNGETYLGISVRDVEPATLDLISFACIALAVYLGYASFHGGPTGAILAAGLFIGSVLMLLMRRVDRLSRTIESRGRDDFPPPPPPTP